MKSLILIVVLFMGCYDSIQNDECVIYHYDCVNIHENGYEEKRTIHFESCNDGDDYYIKYGNSEYETIKKLADDICPKIYN